MGLLIGLMRRRQLNMEKSTLAWKILLITTAMASASRANENLMQVGTDYESDSLIAKKIQQREYKFKLLEEKLKLQKEEYETRLQEIEAELNVVRDMINNGIQEMFGSGR